MNITSDAKSQVNRLLRGISTYHVETTRDAWRELLKDSESSVPVILETLASPAWKDNPRGPLAEYLGVLLSLLDELSPTAFRQEITRLSRSKFHPMHRKTIELLSRRCNEKPTLHIGPDIPVYIAADIEYPSIVISNLKKWSMTRDIALDCVTRIDVIARHPNLDYLGRYNLLFSGIILTWPTCRARGLRLWWRKLDAEFTFYHEIGHHACGHIEGGQVAEQEKEADDYSTKAMRRSRPIFTGCARILLAPFRPLIKRLSARVDKNGRTPS